MSAGWRTGAIAREALANLASTRAQLTVLAAVIGGLAATVVWLELAAVGDAIALEQRFARAGGYVAVVASERGVDAAACDQLRRHPDVVASGGYRATDPVAPAMSPRVTFQRVEITAGLVELWDPAGLVVSGSYLVGQAAADELGLVSGSWLELNGVGRATTAIVDPSARNPFVSRAIMDLVPPTGTVDECWIEFRPGAFEAGLAMLPAMFVADEPQLRRAVDRGEFAEDPDERIASRITRFGWASATVVAAAVMALLSIVRRPETAVYRAFDMSRSGVVLMLQLETAVLALACGALGACWALAGYSVLVDVPTVGQAALALRGSLLFMLALVACGPLVAAIAASGTPASLLKER